MLLGFDAAGVVAAGSVLDVVGGHGGGEWRRGAGGAATAGFQSRSSRFKIGAEGCGVEWFAMRWSAVVAAGILLAPFGASAQEDVTPPVLLEFSLTPVAFDTGTGDVLVEWCASARDELSGVTRFELFIQSPDPGGDELLRSNIAASGFRVG